MDKSCNIILASLASISTIYCSINLASFISDHQNSSTPQEMTKSTNNETESTQVLGSLIINLALLCLFVVQHSMMATPEVKQFLKKQGLQVAERSIYVIGTTFTLTLLTNFWVRMPNSIIWHINTIEYQWCWWMFSLVHFVSWYIIYAGSLIMDCLEMVGIKQVYYDLLGFKNPLQYKSTEVCRLYQHMRHPSFIGFCILFWVHPFMSVDRLLLAIVFTLYMITSWRTDPLDYKYQCNQLQRKQRGLKTPCRAYYQ